MEETVLEEFAKELQLIKVVAIFSCDSHSLNGDPPLFMQNKCLYIISSFQRKKETPTKVFSCGIYETFKKSGGCL